jgi:MFS family permease
LSNHGAHSGTKREATLCSHEVYLWLFVYDVRCRSLILYLVFASLTFVKYDAGVLGGVLLHKPFLDAIGNPTGVYIIPMISSSYSLAACVTSFFVAFVAFRIGRRGTIILGCVAAVVGSVIQASLYSVAQLIVERICTVSGVSMESG